MEIAELLLKYLDVVAWPLVVVTALVVFRGRLRDLMGRVTQAEGPMFKAQFAELRDAAEHKSPVEPVVEVQGTLNFDASEGTNAVETKPVRQPYIEFPVRSLVDLVPLVSIFKSHDKVVVELDGVPPSTSMMVGTFLFGYSMGDTDMRVDDELDSDHPMITLRHWS